MLFTSAVKHIFSSLNIKWNIQIPVMVTDLFVKLHIHVILKALNMRLSGLKANYNFYINTQQYHCVTGAHVISVLCVGVPLVCNRSVTATDGVCMEKRGSLGVSVSFCPQPEMQMNGKSGSTP